MITPQDLYDLYTHYVSESNKWKIELDKTHRMKAGTKYNICDEISNLLWHLYIKSQENDSNEFHYYHFFILCNFF